MSARVDTLWRIRPMVLPDIDAVIAIERRAYDFPWSARIFRDCLRVGYRAWVAVSYDGRIGGYTLASIAVGEAHLLNLCVAPETRQQGVASRLLEAVIARARDENAGEILLEVRPSNTAARRLYARYDFETRGRRPNYYPCPTGREDALILSKVIA